MKRALLFVAVVVTACTRVPPEWRDARRVAAVEQSACVGSLADLDQGRRERIEARGGAGSLHVDFLDAHFRCEQRVTALVRVHDANVELLVQPEEMHPLTVAKCDCLYDIRIDVSPLAPGTYDVTLQRRWDDRHSPNDPETIGRVRAVVK